MSPCIFLSLVLVAAPPPPPPPAAANGKPAAPAKDGAAPAKKKEEPKPAPVKKVANPDKIFENGVRDFGRGNYGPAADAFFKYVSTQEPNARYYDWSEYYLGRALRAAGLNHAGDEYLYNIAKNRSRPDLVPDALRALEADIRGGSYDEDLLVKDLVAGGEYNDMPDDIRAFIQYFQGMVDLREERMDWASDHFSRIPKGTRYSALARSAQAVVALNDDKLEEAQKLFEENLTDPDIDRETLNETHRSLARLLFEQEDYVGALKKYEDVKVPFLSTEEASIFLEKAWARYYLKDYRGALAILLSLDAPSYRQTYFPERWILEALIYKALCHYAAAQSSAREFTRRYGDALRAVRDLRTPLAHPTIRNAALQSTAAARRLRHLRQLTTERDRLLRFSAGKPVIKHLSRVYDLKVKETGRLLEQVLEIEAERTADELLDVEEQARLVDYEVGLEVFRRVPQAAKRSVVPKRSTTPLYKTLLGTRDVHYVFDGEYWNDELHDYQVSIEDRCFAEGLFK